MTHVPPAHCWVHSPTGTCDGLVDGADVDAGGRGLPVGFRDQPDDGHFRVELLGPGLDELSALAIPARSLQEEAVDVAAHIRLLRQLRHRLDPHLGENDTSSVRGSTLHGFPFWLRVLGICAVQCVAIAASP